MRTVLILFLLMSSIAAAQHPRMLLVEEGTNASCEPCANQNPIFESFLARADVAPYVVPIIYHSNWPGRDTMNLLAPAMHEARVVTYYGMVGMPTALVNGMYYRSATPGLGASAPADTQAIRLRVDSMRAMTSPILITIADTIVGDRVVIATRVASSEALAHTLRIAVVERYHYYGWQVAGNNGEEHFHRTVSAMAPDPLGHALSLAAGGEQTFYDTVSINPAWTRSELYVVAFVQRDDTREVLQAASTQQDVSIATVPRAGRVSDTTSQWKSSASATREGMFVVSIEREMPLSWRVELDTNGVAIDAASPFTVSNGIGALEIAVRIIPSASAPGKGVVRLIVRGDRGAVDTSEFRLYAGDIGIPVLSWHERFRPDHSSQVDVALARTSHKYAMVHADDDDLFTLTDHPLVVAMVGDDTLDLARRNRLRAYLNARGRLLIMGTKIAQSLGDPEFDENGIPRDTSFLHNYLHGSYVAPGSSTLAVNGIRNDPIGRDIGFILDGGHFNVASPERIRPRHNALPVFHYGSSRDSVGALRYGRPEHRLVYIAYGVESIADTSVRAMVLDRSIEWLLGSEITVGVRDERTASFDASMSIAPNPARDVVVIETRMRTPGTLAIYSVLGKRVVSQTVAAGIGSTTIDVSNLTAGTYMTLLTDGESQHALWFIIE